MSKKKDKKNKKKACGKQNERKGRNKKLTWGPYPKENLQQRHLVPSIKNNFYESQREFPHNTQLSSHYSALKRQLSNNIC